MRRLLLACICSLGLAASAAQAQDEIIIKGREKPLKGLITAETALGIKVGAEFVPAADVVDVVYSLSSTDALVNFYRPAMVSEKDANDPAKADKRVSYIKEALKHYEGALDKIQDRFPRRHIQYKVGLLYSRLAEEEAGPPDRAIKDISDFQSKFPDSWQFTRATQTLVALLTEQGRFEEAATALDAYNRTSVAEDAQRDAQISAIEMRLRAGKRDVVAAEIKKLAKDVPANSNEGVRLKIIQAELLASDKREQEAVTLLTQAIGSTTDGAMRGAAHNALGALYLKGGEPNKALWEFLWVDVVYSQDAAQQAKALYYLTELFEQRGESDKAQRCRYELLNGDVFAGTEYQLRARKELRKK